MSGSSPTEPTEEQREFAAQLLYECAALFRDSGDEPKIAKAAQLVAARDRSLRRWMPCTERMPPVGVWVLTIYTGEVQHVAYRWDGTNWEWEHGDENDDEQRPCDIFSHWQPLPPPPEDDDEH